MFKTCVVVYLICISYFLCYLLDCMNYEFHMQLNDCMQMIFYVNMIEFFSSKSRDKDKTCDYR